MSSTPDQELKQLQLGHHACSMHESAAQQTTSGVIFTRTGLERGERCIYVADDANYESVVHAFATGNVDVAEAQGKRRAHDLAAQRNMLALRPVRRPGDD